MSEPTKPPMLDSLHYAVSQLQEAAAAKKCWTCGHLLPDDCGSDGVVEISAW